MKSFHAIVAVLALASAGYAQLIPPFIDFNRGDANNDGYVNMSDSVFIQAYLYDGASDPGCLKAADVNDDGQITLTDVVYLNEFLFRQGAMPLPPFPGCGRDPTPDGLSCVKSGCL